MGADLVDVSIDVYSGQPGNTTISRTCDAPDMDIRQQDGAVRGRGNRANSKGRADYPATYQRRSRIPILSPGHCTKAIKQPDSSIRADSQHLLIVCSDIDHVTDGYGACQRKIAGRDRIPRTPRQTPTQRVAVNDSKGSPVPVGHKAFDLLPWPFLMADSVGKGEQPVVPGSGKYGRIGHHRVIAVRAAIPAA